MLIENNLALQVDLPVFEQTNFMPLASSAISASCAADNSLFNEEFGRYIFVLISTTGFYKYDTWTDTFVQLTSPPITPLTFSSMKFSGAYGFEARVLAASSNTITIPAYYAKALNGFDFRIIQGTGKGTQRIITDVADPISADSGIATAVSTTSLTDSTKNWTINQWVGYQMRITFGTGVAQVRRILHNTSNTITFQDNTRVSVDNSALVAVPTPALSATAGSQSVYTIESSVVTVDDSFDVTPDETSKIRVFSGAILLVSSAAATPFFTIQLYDIVSDIWYIKTATTNLVSAVGTDCSIERTTENASVWTKGKASSGSTTTLVDSTKNWTVNEFANKYLYIYSGIGKNQIVKITSNTSNTLTFSAITTAPDSTSRYMITGFDAGTASSASAITLVDSSKTWITDRWKNYVVRIVAGTGKGQTLPILSNTSTTLTLYKSWTTTPDSTSIYQIQGDKDNIYMMFAGQASTFIHSFEMDMATQNRSFDDGCTRIGAAQFGDFPAVAITSITGATSAKTVTTAIPHGFKTGWSIKHTGDTGASAVQNNITAVITVTGATTYTYTATGSTAAATYGTLSTTTLVDSTKNWTVNEHANKICWFLTAAPVAASGLATMVAMEIASNTANTLTFKTATTIPVNGVSRYSITARSAIGALDSGIATGTHSTTTLQDTSKTWVVNIFAGRRLKMLSGTGQSIEIAIASNTSNTLTFAITTAPVSASTSYSILAPVIRGTGVGLSWIFGNSDLNKQGKFIVSAKGGGLLGFDRLDLTTDQWDVISTSPMFDSLTTGSMYAYDGVDRLYYTLNTTMILKYIDMNSLDVHGASQIPYTAGTGIIGNRMEIFETKDGLKYLWVNKHSAQDCFRQL